MSAEGKIIVYRRHFEKLLSFPKPLRDQLIIELPIKEGLRTTEVCTLRSQDVDFEHGDLWVLDSKKHRLMVIPLDAEVAQHLAEYIQAHGVKEGILLAAERKSDRKGKRGRLSKQAIEYLWNKWCRIVGIPKMSPRYGRAYFAVDWHVVKGKSLIGLRNVLRHDEISSTEAYLNRIYSYEDTKAEFQRGNKWFSNQSCSQAQCPISAVGCYCKMFKPKIELKI